jgi:uncharacterized membrane protein
MPYEWTAPDAGESRLRLWPYRSLTARGFVWFIGATAALIALPLLSLLGSPVLWALLPFVAAAVAAIWWALRRNANDREIMEALTLTPDRITLTRSGPRGRRQEWQDNPYWVRVTLHAQGGPVPNYLTLKGIEREVEVGAFLSEAERLSLREELASRLASFR